VSEWTVPPAQLRLAPDELSAWLIPIDAPPHRLRDLAETLSPDEQRRAARFHFERDRIRFMAARGALRGILGAYLRRPPAEIVFAYSPHGKPSLADEPSLSFNISHSGDWALCAVALNRRIGVDIESIQPELAGQSIAERFFSPREVAELRALPSAEQSAAFFRCWTRKEAFVKARGEGLSLPLDRFDVSLRPGAPPALLSTLDDPREADRWSILALPAPPGYVASAVVEGPSPSRVFRFIQSP
jgi:4'-phosphopantetheinyl transferase